MTERQPTKTGYHADFKLDESGNWVVELEELPQVHSFGRTLGKARERIVDALALWLDCPVARAKELIQFRSPHMPPEIQSTVAEAIAARQIAEIANEVSGQLMTSAAVQLVKSAHLSMRDASDILGISHQRVQQIVSVNRSTDVIASKQVHEVADDVVRYLRQFVPGGEKEDLGVLAGGLAVGLAIYWIESRR